MTVNELRALRGLDPMPGDEGDVVLPSVPWDVPPEYQSLEWYGYNEAIRRYILWLNSSEKYVVMIDPSEPEHLDAARIRSELHRACRKRWGVGVLTRTDRNEYRWSTGPAERVPGEAARALFAESEADAPLVVNAKESVP